jgi:polyvinyl alcohol dehydrogenase (cytochrome)
MMTKCASLWIRTFLTCGLLAATSPVALGADNQWIMGGQNLQNWRYQSNTGINRETAKGLKLKWTFTTGGDVSATPAVANGIVYFPDFVGDFYAVNAATGALVWQQKVGNWTGFPNDYARNDPVVNGNTVILGNQGGNFAFWDGSKFEGSRAWLIAVNANTGALQWKTQVEAFPTAMITSSPVIYGNTVYVGIASAELLDQRQSCRALGI